MKVLLEEVERLRGAELSEKNSTAFVERLNLITRQCVSKLPRRIWRPARYPPDLMDHLGWGRSLYHFLRFLEGLSVVFY